MSQDSIIIYRDIREAVMGLPPELCKAVMKAIFDYAFDDIEPEEDTDAVVKGFYLAFKSRFDMNIARLEKNKANGKKGGNPNFTKGKRNPYYPKGDNQQQEIDNREITENISEDNPKITQRGKKDNREITEDNGIDKRDITEKRAKSDKRGITGDNPNITENDKKDNPDISEDNLYLYPYQYNNNSVDVVDDNAHARERENNRKFLDEFFKETNRAQIEVICMQLHTDPKTLRSEAEEVIAEWELTEITHGDYSDQARHLINQLRIKYRSKANNDGTARTRKAAAETAPTGKPGTVCEGTKAKKKLRSTI